MSLIPEHWTLEFHSGIPIYKQIVHQVRAAVADGRLRAGEQLPTVRALHLRLNVNPNTVAKAYRELEHLGVIATEHGTGCFVADQPKIPKRPAGELKSVISQLCARFSAEARSHGISTAELIQHLNHLPHE